MVKFLFTKTPLFYWIQSLWRDEAFSIWIAEESFSEVIRRTSGDFNPPFYYLLLHLWMKIFGRSEIALRSLSLLAFFITLYVVYLIGQQVFKKKSSLAIYLTLLTATNPMLLYYAFELRMYAQLAMFTALSTYFLLKRRFWSYVISAVLGAYTQPYMFLVILAQNLFLFLKKEFSYLLMADLFIGLLYLPWLPILVSQFLASGPMWIWPIDRNLILSVLGNLYIGYEGTPPQLWPYMKWFSLFILAVSSYLFIQQKRKDFFLYTLIMIYLPLIVVLGISLFKPIYVLRYVIFITLGEIFLLTIFISYAKNVKLQKALFVLLLLFNIFLNFYMVPHHTKVDIRQTFAKIIPLLNDHDLIYAQTPLVYYESLYYAPDKYPVYLWNPHRLEPLRYVGGVGMPSSVWAISYPIYPSRAFMIQEDGSYQIYSSL